MNGLFALPGQLLENGSARRIGKSAEHVIGMGWCHRETITIRLFVVKKKLTIFDGGLPGNPALRVLEMLFCRISSSRSSSVPGWPLRFLAMRHNRSAWMFRPGLMML
jgi:hypothetical protein